MLFGANILIISENKKKQNKKLQFYSLKTKLSTEESAKKNHNDDELTPQQLYPNTKGALVSY